MSGDLNNDGFDDLIVSAPGYSSDNNIQRGRVYIIYGNYMQFLYCKNVVYAKRAMGICISSADMRRGCRSCDTGSEAGLPMFNFTIEDEADLIINGSNSKVDLLSTNGCYFHTPFCH